MKLLKILHLDSDVPRAISASPRLVAKLEATDLQGFKSQWASRCPVVVSGVHKLFQGTWSPQYFIQQYGRDPCTLIDCVTLDEYSRTVGDFFSAFGKEREADGPIMKLKVSLSRESTFYDTESYLGLAASRSFQCRFPRNLQRLHQSCSLP